jgi:hypothetical protein
MSAASSTKNPLHGSHLDVLNGIKWNDLAAVRAATMPVLDYLARNMSSVIEAMHHVAETPSLMARCESDGFFDRVILYEDQIKEYSIRLHFLVPSEYDRPHNHRATFAAKILTGRYVHTTFALPADIETRTGVPLTEKEVRSLSPVMVREEIPGCCYVMHHTGFHSTISTSDHASVLIRGPSAKDRLLFLDQRIGTATWMYGGQFEAAEPLAIKAMKTETLRKLTAFLDSIRSQIKHQFSGE